MRTPAHTRAHLHTPAHTPHIPTDALNLINHMKLHVNGKMAERNKERKKKEQESAEAISGLKICVLVKNRIQFGGVLFLRRGLFFGKIRPSIHHSFYYHGFK